MMVRVIIVTDGDDACGDSDGSDDDNTNKKKHGETSVHNGSSSDGDNTNIKKNMVKLQ